MKHDNVSNMLANSGGIGNGLEPFGGRKSLIGFRSILVGIVILILLFLLGPIFGCAQLPATESDLLAQAGNPSIVWRDTVHHVQFDIYHDNHAGTEFYVIDTFDRVIYHCGF